MSGGVRRRADIDADRLHALNTGGASSRTLAEALAIDHTILLRSVLRDADDGLCVEIADAQELGILKRVARVGSALASRFDADGIERLSTHPSDTVRGWICFLLAARADGDPAALLDELHSFVDDEHFAVREWVWMAARPVLVAQLETSIGLLSGWTGHPSERVRRFAVEALRPRGVWAAHIAALKQRPELGESILHPLRADPSRYVQDSVSNWINDAAKTRPDWAKGLCGRWLAEGDDPATARIVQRALRSL